MATIEIRHGEMIVVTEGIGAMWAVRCLLEIPLGHVTGVELDSLIAVPDVPSKFDPTLDAFTVVVEGDRVFWNVRSPWRALSIRLAGGRYQRLVVEVDDPTDAADRINLALQAQERRDAPTS